MIWLIVRIPLIGWSIQVVCMVGLTLRMHSWLILSARCFWDPGILCYPKIMASYESAL